MSENWIAVADRDAVPQEDVIAVEVDGREIALYGVEGQVYATDNVCTHAHARLCEGFLEGGEIECPLHQGRFDVRTGKGLCAPVTEDLRIYPVKVQDNKVFVEVN
jgi:naphthalene 1,2-dioxygenase ferredoxin component